MNEQTIEELEIIIRAKVDDAIKNITKLTNSIKEQVRNTMTPMKEVATKTKDVATKSVDSFNRAKKTAREYNTEINNLVKQQESLKNKIAELNQIQQEFPILGPGVEDKKMNSQLNSLTNELERVQDKLRELKNEDESLSDEAKDEIKEVSGKLNELRNNLKNISDGASQGTNKLWSAFKKGSLILLGVRSAFSLIKQGMNSAIGANEDLQSQTSVTSNAIGQIFVPAMKLAQDAIQYVVISVALLIKLFTGYNALAKVTTNSINKTNKAAKGLNKTLTGIDDIDVLNSDKGSLLGGNYASDLKALQEFQEKIAQVEALFEKWDVKGKVDKIKDAFDKLKKALKPLWDNILHPMLNWLLEHPTVLETVFGIILTGKLLKKVKELLGSSTTGLLGLEGNLGRLAKIGAIAISVAVIYNVAKNIYKDVKEMRKALSEESFGASREFVENFYDGINEELIEEINNGTIKQNAQKAYDNLLSSLNTANVNISSMNSAGINLFSKDYIANLDKVLNSYDKVIEQTKNVYKNTDLTKEEYDEIRNKLVTYRDNLVKIRGQFPEGTKEWSKLNDEIGKSDDLINDLDGTYKSYSEDVKVENKKVADDEVKNWENTKESIKLKFTAIKEYFSNLKDKAKETSSNIKTSFGESFDNFKTRISETTNSLKTKFTDGFNNVKSKCIESGNNFKTKFSEAFNDSKSKLSQIFNNNTLSSNITNLGSKISGIFDKKYTLKTDGDTSSLTSKLNSALKGAVSKMGNIFGGISSIGSGKSFSSWFSGAKKILGFAKGNVATQPTVGVFGEYANAKSNPEITSPKNIMADVFRSTLQEYGMSNNNQSSRTIVNIGNEKLVDYVADGFNDYYDRNGVSILKENELW